MKIVFVHLGINPVPHLWLNLKSLQDRFQELDLFLLLDSKVHEAEARKVSCKVIYVDQREISGIELNRLIHNPKFRNGFWTYSVQRFYALAWFHESFPDEPLIHFESDILVLPNFPWKAFRGLENCAWPKFNELSDAASIFYSPNSAKTQQFLFSLREILQNNESLTDMTALSAIYKTNPGSYIHLPTSPSSTELSNFGGIFDAAPIGMWLSGRDPRNHYGFVKKYLDLPEAEFDVSKFKINFNEDILELEDENGNRRNIYNLHLHSKRLTLFSRWWKPFLKIDIKNSRKKNFKTTFSLRAFYSVVNDFYTRNKFSDIQTFVKIYEKIINRNAS